MSDEIYQKITSKEKEFADLWNRNDEDKKLLIMDKFVWRDKDDREEPDVDNITLNDAANFAKRVHNTLTKAEIVPEVTGKNLQGEIEDYVESFLKSIEIEADAHVSHQDIPAYKNFEIMQACDRGRVARRITLREKDGELAPDSFSAIDSRYLIYDYGIDGLRWVATKMPRSKEDIEDEYGYVSSRSNDIITDHWDEEEETVFCGKEVIFRQENYWQEPPFVIQVLPTGIFTFDADRFLYSGESIFSTVRPLFEEKNMFATILKSLTIKSFFNGLQLEVENVGLAKKPKIPPYRKRIVAPVEKGTKGYFQMPIQELVNTARMFYSILDSAIQDATFPRVSFGTLQFPVSAVGMTELKEAEDPVYFPVIQGYTLFLQRLYEMIMRQYKMFKMNLPLGQPGLKETFSWEKLPKDISIRFRVDLTSPKEDMVNISTAAALGNILSDETKMKDYLRVKNYEDENRKKLLEKASRMSPAVAKYDVCKALFDSGEKVKANLMAEELGLTLDQMLSGELTEPSEAVPEQQPRQLIPMYGGGMGGGSRTRVAGEEQIPEVEE